MCSHPTPPRSSSHLPSILFYVKEWEESLEGSDGAIEDLALSFSSALHHCDNGTHIIVYMGEAIQGVLGGPRPVLGILAMAP